MEGNRPSGIVALLALFAILCTIFCVIATIADWVGGHAERLHTNLQLVAIALTGVVALVPLARHLAAKEAHETLQQPPPADGHSLGWGIVCAAIGVAIVAAAAFRVASAAHPAMPDEYMAIPAGLIFVFGGIVIALPVGNHRARGFFAALLMTAFAATFDWIAFGPGERHFSGGISLGFGALGFAPPELLGRIAFGIPAAITTVVAVVMWVRI